MSTQSGAAVTSSTSTPQITGIYNDYGAVQGYLPIPLSSGLFTNDSSPLVRVSLAGTTADAGDFLRFTLAFSGASVGPLYAVTADDIAAGYALVQFTGLPDAQYPLIPNIASPEGTLEQSGYVAPINIVTKTPATPYIAGFFDDTSGRWNHVVSNTTTDTTPIVRVFMPGVSEAQGPYSPGHPPFGNPNPIVGGTVQLYSDGVEAGTGYINYYGYVDFVASQLTPGTHMLTVAAIDKAGNVSAQSAPVTLTIGASGQNIVGTDDGEELSGSEGDDRIEARGGNDALTGKGGYDVLIGGLGDDWYYVNDEVDLLIEKAGEGWDNVWATTDFTLPDHIENLYLANAAFNTTFDYDGTGNDLGNQLRGNNGANLLHGLGGNDALQGVIGDDILVGGAGDDYLEGGEGRDLFVFGSGDGHDRVVDFSAGEDVLDFTAFGDDPTFTLSRTAEGWSFFFASGDQVDVVTAAELTAGVDYFISTADNVIQGTDASDSLTGTDAADRIEGLGGNDALAGGGGLDILVGGQGHDWYYLSDDSDTLVELAGEGWDNVWSTVSHELADNIENLYLAGDAPIDATGNALGNQLVGNDAANVLQGLGGDDALRGGGGADRFVFGAGDGHDVIVDFELGQDQIAWRGDVFSWTVSQEGADALVRLEGGDTIRLLGVLTTDLDAALFGSAY